MSKKKGNGGIVRYRGWWTVRYRETVYIGGEVRTIQRRKRLVPVSEHYKTTASVEELAADHKPEKDDNRDPVTVTTLGDFFDTKYLPYVRKHKRPSTVRGYQQLWRCYFKPRGKSSALKLPPITALIKDIKTHHVQEWLETIAEQDGVSRTTMKHAKHFLSGIFKYAVQQDYRDSALGNPVTLASIPPNLPEGKEGHAYSFEEINQMLEVLLEPAGTVVATAAYGGFREGELRGLQWEDYRLASGDEALGMLYVTRSVWRKHIGAPKTKKSKAPVPVIPQLAARLAAWRELCGNPSSGPIFANGHGRPLDLDWLYRARMKDVLAKAGIQWTGWHGFRRGLATNLNRLGVDDSVIQAILRHSTVATTQAHYIKTERRDAVDAMQKFSRSMTLSGKR